MRASSEEYLRQLQALMPKGRAWPIDGDALLTKLLGGFSGSLGRNHNRAVDLIDEADPRTATELLTDWERICGLPDACSAAGSGTLGERRDAVVAKLTTPGGQSRRFFIDLAAALGFTVTITEHKPFQAGQSTAGDPVMNAEWRFNWLVNAPKTTVRSFSAGNSGAGEPLRTWGNKMLECVLRARKPAHTQVNFSYYGG